MNKARRVLVRQWELVRHLASKRYGLTVGQLAERTGTSTKTLRRDLETLGEAGVPIASTKSNGEARYHLMEGLELPALGLTSLQIAALHLARSQLEPLAGAAFVDELDCLLAKLRPVEAQRSFQFADHNPGRPRVLRVVEQAIQTRRRARIQYRSTTRRGAAATVHVEPQFLRVADNEPYFRAYCVERAAFRTYKVARVVEITLTDEPAIHVSEGPPDALFEGAVKAWSGRFANVRVRLGREVGWLVDEYPLVFDQRVERDNDGTAVVEARVAGLVETLRWVLSWGDGIEALEPPELRAAVRDELARALRKYGRPGPKKAVFSKSTRAMTRRDTQAGNGGA